MKPTPKLLKKFIESNFEFEEHGNEWVLPSPENPKKKKLYINIDNGLGHDFLTGEGYSPFQLFKLLGNFDTDEDAQSYINRFALANIKEIDLKEELSFNHNPKKEKPIVQRIPLPNGTKSLLEDHFTSKIGLSYILSRGLTKKDIEKYHLRIGTQGDYDRRIIIPFIEEDEIVWYQGRHLNPTVMPKYLNPSGVDKSALVYNIDAVKKQAIIVEGPIDAMMVDGQAIMGIKASEWQIQKILDKKPNRLVVVPDMDEPRWHQGRKIMVGLNGAMKTIEGFIEAGYPKSQIFVALIDGGKDLNDIGKEKALELVDNAEPLSFSLLVKLKTKGVDVSRLAALL